MNNCARRLIPLVCLPIVAGLSIAFLVCSEVQAWQIDEKSVPELVEMLASSDVTERRDAVYELVNRGDSSKPVIEGFARLVSDNDTQVQFQALLGLARAGAPAEPAIDSLIAELDDRSEQVRYRAADALGKIGNASVKPMLDRWPEANRFERIGFCQALGEIGSSASDAVPILKAALAEGETELHVPSALGLQKIAPRNTELWKELAGHASENVRVVAIRQLAKLDGANVERTALLIAATTDDSRRVREAALIAVTKSDLGLERQASCIATGLVDESVEVRAAAIAALARNNRLAPTFAASLLDLMESCSSPEVAVSLLKAMERLGESSTICIEPMFALATKFDLDADAVAKAAASTGLTGLSQMMKLLPEQPEVEPYVSRAISAAGDSAKALMVEAFESEDEILRIAAARASGQFNPPEPDLVERLIVAATDEEPAVRRAVIEAVGKVAAELRGELKTRFSPGLATAIETAASDTNESTRATALSQLPLVEMSSELVEDLIERGLEDSSKAVKLATLGSLESFSGILNRQSQRVLEIASSGDGEVRASALRVAGLISKKSTFPEVQAVVQAGLAADEALVRIAATSALIKLGLDSKEAVELVGENLGQDVEVLRASLEAVESLGPKAGDLEPTVAALIRHPKVDIRIQAVEALGKVSSEKKQLTNHLVEALHDEDWTVRRAACEELGRVGEEAEAAIPRLFEMIDSEEDERIATATIRDIDSAPLSALPQLLGSLNDDNFRKRLYAVFLIGKIGPDARSALPKLEEALAEVESQERSGTSRRYLMQAIDEIKGEDSE